MPASRKIDPDVKATKVVRMRKSHVQHSCARALPGTPALVQQIIYDSLNPGWYVARSAALQALATRDAPTDQVWMTKEEFSAFLTGCGLARRSGATLKEEFDIGADRRMSMLNGSPITIIEAFACAHYAMHLPLPVPAGDNAAFMAWVTERFGTLTDLAKILRIPSPRLRDRISGFHMRDGERVEIPLKNSLVRAIDWVWRMGPRSPYGNPPPVALWPGQPEGLR